MVVYIIWRGELTAMIRLGTFPSFENTCNGNGVCHVQVVTTLSAIGSYYLKPTQCFLIAHNVS